MPLSIPTIVCSIIMNVMSLRCYKSDVRCCRIGKESKLIRCSVGLHGNGTGSLTMTEPAS